MNTPFVRWCLALASLLTAPLAQAAMSEALAASQLLSGLVDARVVRFEMPLGRDLPAKRVHAVVLSFDGVLWLYTPGLGTCVLGPARDADLAARLQRFDPTLRNVTVFNHPVTPPPEWEITLRNGCVAACFLNLAVALLHTDGITDAGIILLESHDAERPASTSPLLNNLGHSLLAYRANGRWWALDPAAPDAPFEISSVQTDTAVDPVLAAHARRNHYPSDRFRYLPISPTGLKRLAIEARWKASQNPQTEP